MTGPPTYEKKLRKQYRRGCRIQALAILIGGPLGIMMVGIILWLSAQEAYGAAMVFAALVPIVILAGAVVVGYFVASRRNKKLDAAFVPLGMTAKQLFAVARSWRGERAGRAVEAQFFKGPTYVLQVACDAGTRAVMHREHGRLVSFGGRFAANEPLAGLPEPFAETTVRATDEAWVRGLLEDDRAGAAIDELLEGTDDAMVVLALTPTGLMYRVRFLQLDDLTPAIAGRWMANLETVAEAIEHFGASAEGAETNRLEDLNRQLSQKAWWGIAIGCGCVTVLFIVLLFLLILWVGS